MSHFFASTCESAFHMRKDLKVIGEGFYNKNYLLTVDNKVYILRVPKKSVSYDLRTFKEGSTLKFLQKLNFNLSPKIAYASDVFKFIVIEYVDGNIISGEYGLEKLLDVLSDLHNLVLPSSCSDLEVCSFGSRFFNFGHLQIKAYGPMLEKCKPGLSDRLSKEIPVLLETATRSVRLLHGDPARSNFIQKVDGAIRMIDFEFAAIGDPLFDYAFLLNRAFPANRKALNRIIEIAGDDAGDLLRYAIFDSARSIHVVAAKYLDISSPQFDQSRGEKRIDELLCHLSDLNVAFLSRR